MKLLNQTTLTEISNELSIASSFIERGVGLLGKKDYSEKKALWIKKCPSVHTFFMKFSIDVVFVDKNLIVTKVYENLKPWRMTSILSLKNNSCFEFKAQNISQKVTKGDRLNVCS